MAHVWSLWKVNVGLPQLIESGEVICFAAKWEHEDKVMFHRGPSLVAAAYKLLDKADAVVHFNGDNFDLPWLRSEFVKAGMTPPSPFASIDLCTVAKRTFRFPSNKLEYLAGELLGERKLPTGGHGLWIKCMAGDRKAWETMRHYNEQDVLLTERLYHRLKPWIKRLPNPALYGDTPVGQDIATCCQCGSVALIRRGLAHTQLQSYVRFSCNDCGRWQRGKNRVGGVIAR